MKVRELGDKEIKGLFSALGEDEDSFIPLGDDDRTLEQLICCMDGEQKNLLEALGKAVATGGKMNPARIHEVVRVFYLTEEEALESWYKKCINEMRRGADEPLEDKEEDILN